MVRFKLTTLLTLILLAVALPVSAADLKLVADRSAYRVGDTIAVRLLVTSPKESVNAISGTLAFSSDQLQTTSLSKAGSIITMWVQEPAYSNQNGEVNFEGAVLNPGFTGPAGQLLTVNFKAKKAGTINLRFTVGSVLANDGEGTSLLKNLGQLSLTISPAGAPTPAPAGSSAPAKKSTSGNPATTTLDTQAPEQFEVNQIKTTDASRAQFIFSAVDRGSGLDRYEFQIDGSSPAVVAGSASGIFTAPALSAGAHTLTTRVFDRAGNSVTRTVDFSIVLTAPAGSFANWSPWPVIALIFGGIFPLLFAGILIMFLVIVWRRLDLLELTFREEMNRRPTQGPPGPRGEAGPMGPAGLPGEPGRDGAPGLMGPKGESIVGPQGEQGLKGEPGENGRDGRDGLNGEKGDQGERGEKGERGELGPVGPMGPQGITGAAAAKGDPGLPGPKGDTGPMGPKGDKGDRGEKGEVGLTGLTGAIGLRGEKGETGENGQNGRDGKDGLNGQDGKDGRDGLDGADGKDGKDGKDGAPGPIGPKGDKGDRGETGDIGPQGIQGVQGPRGDKGDKGDSA